jgi:hypothetical protein
MMFSPLLVVVSYLANELSKILEIKNLVPINVRYGTWREIFPAENFKKPSAPTSDGPWTVPA